jgi:glycosyltransferase involved in cell wall biosynthesis
LPENVICLGRVSDQAKRLLLQAADVALNPMFSGSGTNLKMLEFLAAGLPVVTTPVGARGLHLVSGEHALVCSADAFPPSIQRLLDDTHLRMTLRAEGRHLVEDKYNWEAIVEHMRDTMESTIARMKGQR